MKYLIDHGIIDLSRIQEQIAMDKRNELLKKHPYKIWQGKNGKWYTYLPNAEKGRVLKKRSSRAELEKDIIGYLKKMEVITFDILFHEWIDTKLEYGDIKKQTYDRYEADYIRFFPGSDISKKDFRQITEMDLEHFIKTSIHDQELTRKSYSGLRLIIMGTFKYAIKHGYTKISISQFFGDLDLSKRIFRQKNIDKGKEIFTSKEMALLEDFVYGSPPSIINYGILLTFQTGLRVGELSALRHADVSDNILNVSKTEVRYLDGNGNYVYDVQDTAKTAAGNRDVILNSKAMGLVKKIQELNPGGEYLFMKDGERIKEKTFGHRLGVICKKVGIEKRSMHKARKTCATNMINKGVDESLVISQLGHTDIKCTKGYYYFDNTTFDEAQKQIEDACV